MKPDTMTPENVVKKMFQLEEQNNLFEIKVNNIFFYQLIRMQLYYYIIGEKKIYNKQDYSYKNALSTIYYICKECLSWNKRKKLKKNKICIIQHSRKIDGKDIYTDYLKKIVKECTILHQSEGQNYTQHKNSINYDYYLMIKKFFTYLGFSYPNKDKNVKKFIKIFKEAFLLDDSFEYSMYYYIQNQLNAYKVAINFLKNTNFKKIIVVNSYGNQSLIYAANEIGLDTIELQHGVINNIHMGYHFPKLNSQILSFPKKLILFGDFWRDKANFPINNNHLISLGSPHFDESYTKLRKDKKKINDRVLVLSQQTMQKNILEFIKKIISFQKNVKFTYKAHPKEDIRIAEKFLNKHNLINNVEIIHGNKNIYTLFEKHTIQIGVFSTALYEGYSCNLKTGIIKAPGWESMKSFINYPNVFTVEDFSDFQKMINSSSKNSSSAFFRPDAKKNFSKFFE